MSSPTTTPPAECPFCENPLPQGCGHFAGHYPECMVGPRADREWRIGLAIWKNLTDRRSIKWALQECDLDVQIEIVETMGRLAIEEMAKS